MVERREIHGLSAFQLSQCDVEELLIQDGDDPRLRELFGAAGAEELRAIASQSETRRQRRDVHILLLPGILGSTIGKPGNFFTRDTIWFDPVSLARGDATKIALRARQKITALGTIPALYAPLRIRLKWAGYPVDDHFFDWRQSIDTLGQQLASRVKAMRGQRPGRKIFVVAHSMGGLVARAAMTAGADIHRLIMLGTPNRGSFGPVQVLRAINSTVRMVDRMDPFHSAKELTTKVFRTFPSLYQMLPHKEVFDKLDLYRLSTWPRQPVRPLKSHLELAAKVQNKLAKPATHDDERFYLIAGCDQETVTDLDLRADETEFNYVITRHGDGTVPLNFAQLAGVPTRYVQASHSGMLSFASVARAVADVIETGQTSELSERPKVRRGARRTCSDAAYQAETLFDGRGGGALSPGEQRMVLESMFTTSLEGIAAQPLEGSSPMANPAAIQAGLNGDVLGGPAILQGVTVGRRRLHRMDLELVRGSLLSVPCRAYVIGVFENVAPSGPALALDKALNGALSEFFSRRLFSGEVGRISIMPAGRNRLHADLVVFAGLGQFDRFQEDPGSVQHLVAQNIIRTLIRSGVEEMATIVMGGGSGQPVGNSLQHLMQGFVEGLLSIDTLHRFRRIILCEMNADRYDAIRERVLRLTATDLFQDMEVTLDERVYASAEGDDTPRIPTPIHLPQQQSTYLSVRIEGTAQDAIGGNAAPAQPSLVASVLSPGGKASVFATRHDLEMDALDLLLQRLDPEAEEALTDLDAFGRALTDLVLPDRLRRILDDPAIRESHLSVIHDSQAARIPWEALRLGSNAPALARGLSRRYLAQNLSIAKWVEQRLKTRTLDVLLIVNPTEDLAGTITEASEIRQTLSRISLVNTEVMDGTAATRACVLKAMRSGRFDVIHYAGHAFFDPLEPGRSGILCSDGVLSGQDLVSLDRLPALIFFNACETGRVRSARASTLATRGRSQPGDATPSQIERSVSLAEAFLRGGIAQYVGTYWPVGDHTAAAFARTFYEHICHGSTVGTAVLQARNTVHQRFQESIDWADYLHYGDANFRLKDRHETPMEGS